MKFSVWPNAGQPYRDVVDLAQWADEHGWHGLWFADHFIPHRGNPDTDPLHEVWGVLAALAVVTTRIRLGPLVCGNTYRHPAVLLKQAITVDHVSNGRVVLGIGAGWEENEHRAYGIPFFTTRERLERLDEAAQLVRGLLSPADHFSFSGRFYRAEDAPLGPRPAGPFPILIGGGGERVTMRIAAQHADEWNVWSTPSLFRHKAAVLDAWCEKVGRDPAAIHRSSQAVLFLSTDESYLARQRAADLPFPRIVGTPAEVVDVIGEYAAAGVDEMIIPDFSLGEPSRRRETLDRFDAEVVPHFR